jgi:hypothetical protein
MNVKQIFAVLALLVLSVSLFAYGSRENRKGTNWFDELEAKGEKAQFTGTVVLENRMFPELKASGKVVKLMVPGMHHLDIDLKDGDQISVEGYFIEPGRDGDGRGYGHGWALKDGEKVLFVTKATIKGVVYDIKAELEKSGFGMYGGMYGGMHGGRHGGMHGGMHGGGQGPDWDCFID